MSEPKKPGEGLDLDDLDLEIEKWTSNFDKSHTAEKHAAPPPAATPQALAGELPNPQDIFEGDIDFIGEGEALGDLLGSAPPPLPPADEVAEADVLSSAPRPARTSSPRIAIPAAAISTPSAELPPAPTDDEIFGEHAQRDFGAAIAGEQFEEFEEPPTAGAIDAPDLDAAPAASEFNESTRIAVVDEALLERAARPAVGKAKPSARRGPAVVRRDQLQREREEAEANDFAGPDSTRIADAGMMEQFAEEAAAEPSEELRFDHPAASGPPVNVELDESFYDDIEIAAEPAAPAAAAKPSTPSAAQRIVSRNVVRRGPAAAPAAPAKPTPAPEPAPTPESSAPALVSLTPDETFPVEPEEPPTGILPLAASIAAQPLEPSAAAAALGGESGGLEVPPADSEPMELVGVERGVEVQAGESAPEIAPSEEDDLPFQVLLPAEAALQAGAVPEVEAPPVPEAEADEEPAAAVAAEAEPEAVAPPREETEEVSAVAALPAAAFDLDPAAFKLPAEAPADEVADDAAALLDLYEREIALTRDPRRAARLRVEAGRAAEQIGRDDRAREHYEDALTADPRYAPAARAMRRLLIRTAAFREAVPFLDAEIALAAPDERRALAAYRADLLDACGEQDLARLAFGELLDARADDVRALMAQIELAFADDRDDEVAEALAGAARHVADAELGGALLALRGRILERAGKEEEALAAYTDAHAASPRARGVFLALSRIAQRGGRVADAAAWDGRFIEGIHDSSLVAAVSRRRAAAYQRAGGSPDAALPALEEALTVAPGDALVLESLADAYQRSGRAADAVRIRQSWADLEPDGLRRAEILRGTAVLDATTLGDAAAAAAALEVAAAADPGDAAAVAELEAAYLTAGNVDAAVQLNRAAADADPEGALFERVRAGRLLERAGRTDEAIAELEAARAAAPESAAVAAVLARLYRGAGRAGELAALLAAVADGETAGDVASARLRAARAAERAALALARSEDPDAEAARMAALDAATAAWRKVLDVAPDSVTAHAALVDLAERRGDGAAVEAALAEIQAALKDAAQAAAVGIRRAALVLGQGAPGAEAPLEQVLALDATEPRTTALLVGVAGAAGAWDDVVRRWADRAEALPEGAEKDALRYRAAAALAERGDDLARAVELVRPVADGRPGFTGAAVLLERAYRRLGDAAALADRLARALGRPLSTEGAEATPPAEPPTEASRSLRVAALVRLGELVLRRVGDPARAIPILADALALRDDAVAREVFGRACAAGGEFGPAADRALSDLKHAEDAGSLAEKAAAYEELARIDADLRGDVASAVLAWETVTEIDPARMSALRPLERYFTAEERTPELVAVQGKLVAALDPIDRAPLAVERARLLELAGETGQAQEAYRLALAADPRSRMALFRLEARARETRNLTDLAELDTAIAAFFQGDARAHSAFLTRAAEVLAELGRTDEAITHFRAAAEALPGHAAPLRAWRRLALSAERWADVVEAAEREAAAAHTDAERAARYHLAGVCAMDRALDGERAVENLRRVLALDPRHDDALRRLRTLFEEQGRYEDLAQLLSARVELETHRERLIEHHHALAALYRDFLGDRDRAKAHLRAVISRDPQNLAAVAALSDIAWEQGQWAEAADALIARAKLEKQPAVLKEIFYRLGLIYAERLPDARWAVKSFERVLHFDPNDDGALEHLSKLTMQTGDWRVALAATERLVAMAKEPAKKVAHLHRIAQIFAEGFKDQKRAEDAYKRALDTDPSDPKALAALVEHYRKARDTTSMRVHLDRVAGQMRQRLVRDPFDGAAYRVISRALAARAQAGVVGSVEAARCAAEISHAVGAAEDTDRALAAEGLRQVPQVKGLGDLQVDEILFHPSIPNGFRQVFRLLNETLAKRYAPDLRRWGVGKGERLPRSGHPARDLAQAVAAELGIGDFEMYVSTAQPAALAVELTDPISLVIGAQLAHTEKPPQVRFAVGRALKLAASFMAVPARLGPDELGALLAGIIRQFDPSFSPPGLGLGAVAEEQQKLGRLISKRLRDEIYPFATEISGLQFDHQALWRGVQHTGNRAGLMVAGSALAALVVLLRIGNHKDIPAARGDLQVEELLRFAVSDEHCEVRRALTP